MRRLLIPVLAALLLWAGTGVAAAVPAPPVAAERATPRALFFGDSYFVGGGCTPDASRGMAAVAAQALGYAPVIHGAPGTGYVAENTGIDAPPYLPQVRNGAFDVRNPRLVVIEGGSNDVGLPLRDIRRNAKRLFLVAKKRFPDALIIVVGPLQTYGPWSDTDGIRDAVRKVARGLRLHFVNPQKWTAGHEDWLCPDFVHPTYEGHQILGARLAQALARRGA